MYCMHPKHFAVNTHLPFVQVIVYSNLIHVIFLGKYRVHFLFC